MVGGMTNSRRKGATFERADFEFFAALGLTTGETASALKLSKGWVQKWAKSHGVKFPNKPTAQRRFHASYEKSQNGCWLWTGADRGNGYGCLMIDGVLTSAHRYSYELKHQRSVPEGLFVCHKCDTRACVNPDHLFLGTPKINQHDKLRKGRDAAPCGENHHASVLTTSDVLAIRASEESGVILAAKYGVKPSTVTKIRKGKAWAHV
jgi:hypothetical protein